MPGRIEKTELLIKQLEAQRLVLEDALAIRRDPLNRADLEAQIEAIDYHISSYREKLKKITNEIELQSIRVEIEGDIKAGEKALEKEFIPKHLFRINPAHYKELLLKTDKANSSKEKKESLEELAAYLFSSCEDLFKVVERNKLTTTAEIDAVVAQNTFIREWGEYFIIECKNWKKPVGAPVISRITGNLQKYKCRIGILFSKEGVTGENYHYAKGEIREQFLLNNLIILVFDKEDLEKIAQGENFLDLLEKKYRDLKFSAKKGRRGS